MEKRYQKEQVVGAIRILKNDGTSEDDIIIQILTAGKDTNSILENYNTDNSATTKQDLDAIQWIGGGDSSLSSIKGSKEMFGNFQSNHTLGFRTVTDYDNNEYKNMGELKPLTINRNPKFSDVSYKFPVTDVEVSQPKIDLSEISNKTFEEAAKKVTSTGDVLFRKEIVAALGKKLKAVDVESAEVDSVHIEDDAAAAALAKLVVDMQLVPKDSNTIKYIEGFIVPKFMKSVQFEGWTVKSLDSARNQLRDVI